MTSNLDAAGAIKSLGWLMVEKIVRLGAGLAVAIALARHLGPADFGLLSYCISLVALVSFLAEMGIDANVKRELLRSPERAAVTLATAARMRLVGALFAGIALMAVAFGLGIGDPRELQVLAVLALTLLQPALGVTELYFHVRSEVRRSARVQTVAVVAGAALRFAMIAFDAALVWFAVAAAAEMLISAALLGWMAHRSDFRWWREAPLRVLAGALLRQSWPLILSAAAVLIYMRIDQVMLKRISGDAEAGIYASAARISEAVYFVPMALVTVLLPWWSRQREAGGAPYQESLQRIYDLLAAVAYGFAVAVGLASAWLTQLLYGSSYLPAAPVLAWHVWAGLFVFSGVIRSQEWVFEDLNRLTLWTTFSGALANIVLNLWLIPPYGARGAAIATVVSYGIAAWLTSYLLPSTRATARRQTVALLVPFLGWRYLRRN